MKLKPMRSSRILRITAICIVATASLSNVSIARPALDGGGKAIGKKTTGGTGSTSTSSGSTSTDSGLVTTTTGTGTIDTTTTLAGDSLTTSSTTTTSSSTTISSTSTSTPPIKVYDTASLTRAITAASAPVTLLLAPGNYDLITISAKAGVTLRSASDSSPAVLRGLYIKSSSGITIDNIRIAGPNTNLITRLWVYQSSDVNLSRIDIPGTAGSFDTPISCAITVRQSANVSLAQYRVSWARFGVCLAYDKNVSVLNGIVRDIQSDGVNVAAVQGLLVQGNDFATFHPLSTDHPDAVQVFATSTIPGSSNVVVNDNLFSRDGGGIVQGVFMRDGTLVNPITNVTITNNVIAGGMYNGIAILSGISAKIANNIVIGYPDMQSWVRVNYAQDVTVEDVKANAFILENGVGSGGNQVVPQSKMAADQAAAQWRAAHGY